MTSQENNRKMSNDSKPISFAAAAAKKPTTASPSKDTWGKSKKVPAPKGNCYSSTECLAPITPPLSDPIVSSTASPNDHTASAGTKLTSPTVKNIPIVT